MKNSIKLFAIILMINVGFTKAYSQISVGVGLSVHIAPPPLPVYTQPECPVDGYLWTPGYWAYGVDGYYWVPGVWVAPPQPGLLWTPGYWGYEGGVYAFHNGYWAHHVGFYGGINYGGGYIGTGFCGGEWHGRTFRYNTAVVNVNRAVVHNTYINNTVINRTTVVNRTSFNGPGGINMRPRPAERVAMNEHHIQPTAQQQSHEQVARRDKSQYRSVNHGHPAITAMNRAGSSHSNANGIHHGGFSNHTNPSMVQHHMQSPQRQPVRMHASVAQHQQMHAYSRMQSPQARRPMGGYIQHHERRM